MDAINEALNASIEANEAADNALELSGGLAEEAEESKKRSQELKVNHLICHNESSGIGRFKYDPLNSWIFMSTAGNR